jgi:hypothetical protein
MEKWHRDQSCFEEDITEPRATAAKISWVRIPMKMVFIARKLRKIERLRQDWNYLFRRDYRNKGHDPEKSV